MRLFCLLGAFLNYSRKEFYRFDFSQKLFISGEYCSCMKILSAYPLEKIQAIHSQKADDAAIKDYSLLLYDLALVAEGGKARLVSHYQQLYGATPERCLALGDGSSDIDGTLEIGTASGLAVSASNGLMPNGTPPNNLMAAWWTDLDLSGGGEWYLGALSDGVYVYDIFEWTNVPRFGDPTSTASFQIWLARGTNLAWFTYGGFAGSTADGTVGVENADGSVGYTYYYGEGSVGSVPMGDLHVDQNSGAAGETHVITFTAKGVTRGPWQNCAEMTGDLFYGTNIACASGTIMK